MTGKTHFSVTFVDMNEDKKMGANQNSLNCRGHFHQHEQRFSCLVSVEVHIVVFVLACRSSLTTLCTCCLILLYQPVLLSHTSPSTLLHIHRHCTSYQSPCFHADVVPAGSLGTVLHWPVRFTRLGTDGD